jgi:hypothetical protein
VPKNKDDFVTQGTFMTWNKLILTAIIGLAVTLSGLLWEGKSHIRTVNQDLQSHKQAQTRTEDRMFKQLDRIESYLTPPRK